MFETLEVFRMADAMTRHAGVRQNVVAGNTANADTPGYKARDVVPFADLVEGGAPATPMRASRARHLHGGEGLATAITRPQRDGYAEPNGNNVSLENEMLKSVEVKSQHDRALAIYRSGLSLMRMSIGRR
ncbi:FlgB family protein [Ferrimonas balearica]|nr:FlgB family protein [Ferrimonas balearica]